MRLDKAVALSGLTRSEAKKMIMAGRVCVNDRPVRDPGVQVEPEQVRIDGGEPIIAGPTYIMLNKPAGVITATEDRSLTTVLDLLPETLRCRGLGPVGRLDRDVTGLVILTDDGQMAHRLISPRRKAEKLYRAQCEGRLTEKEAASFAGGIELSDFTARPARLEILEAGDAFSVADVVLTEGKYHQVKRMFAAVGHPLVSLTRLRIGCLSLDPTLAPGEWRALSREEISELLALCGLDMQAQGR